MTRYPADTPITREAFESSRWGEALGAAAREDYSSMWQSLSTAAREAVDGGRPEQGRVLWLLADACSMMLKAGSINEPFKPFMVMDGKRSALPEDLGDDEIAFLSSIYCELGDLKLKARIADLVWLVAKPRDPQAATAAIDAYKHIPITTESWVRDGRECWDRAIQLCLMLRAGAGDRLQEIEQALLKGLLGSTVDDGYLPIWISDLLDKHRLGKDRHQYVASHLEALAKTYAESGNIQRSRDLFEGAEQWHTRAGNHEKAAEMTVFCAEAWANEAIGRQSSDSAPSHMVAASFYENAIQKYRAVPKAYREAHNVDARIAELRTELNKAGERSLEEMGVISSEPVDISELVQNARRAVRGKPPLDALLALANIYRGAKVEKIREFSRELMAQHPLQALFAATHMSADGRVIAKRSGVDFGSTDAEESALWAETVKHYIMELGIVVQGDIWPALEIVRLEHPVRERDFVMLARQSPLIPSGREQIVGKALYAGFDNDFITALHILVPQLEHLVRCHLKQAGVQTTNLDKNGIENENGLSTLMESDAVKVIFGDDMAFEIKALFCDPFGPNLRNELAHGLIGVDQAQSTYSIYAWWLMLKIVFNTFWNARQRQAGTESEEADDQAPGA
ncbi:DUF4209 domain-containing protein [Halomonas sp. HK25]|uniref:DUF4209 domain-containing protein n=1 Tax=Halomonas sp. HK25 TaxID=3394321 RepID=UPI0039FDBBF2